MKTLKLVGTSIVGGVVITLVTGLFQTSQLIGASWYGYPLTWLYYRVLAPQYNPWVPSYPNLVVDIIFWTLIIAIILFVADYAMGMGKSKGKRK